MIIEKVEKLRERVAAKAISLDLLQQTHAPSSETCRSVEPIA
jgi:hypothetical protein